MPSGGVGDIVMIFKIEVIGIWFSNLFSENSRFPEVAVCQECPLLLPPLGGWPSQVEILLEVYDYMPEVADAYW